MNTLARIALCVLFALAGSVGGAAGAAVWQPPAGTSFSIILAVSPLTVTTTAKAVDLDLFETRASTVTDLKQRGKRATCYMSAGSWENWRTDQAAFPKIIRGKPYAGWPGERWLDIRRIDLLAAPMRARLDKCKAKGFAAVDPDNVDGYLADTGFPLTRADAIRYFRFLSTEAHKRGLAIGLKNATEFSAAVLPQADFAVTEDCFDQGWCRNSSNFISAGKPVFAIEYTDNGIDFLAFCRQAKSLGLSPLLKARNLGVWERRCP